MFFWTIEELWFLHIQWVPNLLLISARLFEAINQGLCQTIAYLRQLNLFGQFPDFDRNSRWRWTICSLLPDLWDTEYVSKMISPTDKQLKSTFQTHWKTWKRNVASPVSKTLFHHSTSKIMDWDDKKNMLVLERFANIFCSLVCTLNWLLI